MISNKRMAFIQRDIIGPVVSTLYKMAPRYQPRKIDVIVDKLIAACQEEINKQVVNGSIQSTREFLRFTLFDAQNWLVKTLQNIPEFTDLNLSQDDLDRLKYEITDIYDEVPWRMNFADIDESVRNINVVFYYEEG